MGIKNVQIGQVGLVGVVPQWLYLETDNTLAQVTTAGYLNSVIELGYSLAENMLAVVSTIETAGGAVSVGVYNVTFSSGNWSLTASSVPAGSITNAQIAANAAIAFSKLASLTSARILVGSAGGVATDVALSGDATLSNAGALTIAANAITTAKILDANVTLAKLAAGISPAYIVKYAGKEANGGGSATVAITVTGAVAGDVVFAQVEASANAVAVQKVTPSTNTVTVLLSGDPGAGTSIAYQVLRAAS